MEIYNTLTRNIEKVTPLNPPEVTVYTCGPTVYDYLHIGNWFTFIRYDLLIRTLTLTGYKPKWVMNITDVGHLVSDADEGEDKLEKGARREGRTAWDIAKFYGDNFMQGMERLNFTKPAYLTKATEHIGEQIELVKKLEAKGYTYVIDDGVYFDTATFPAYADFAQLDIDEQQAGARVSYNEQKRQATDFALWKFSPKDHQRDMEWDSPWGKGFPGWHLECSAMSMKYLGETIDIHAGGIDHIPVHHTNEIAQSEAVTGKPFAHYWMHTNHITVEGEKIAKSAGNGIRLEDIEARGISPMALRLHVLESHYRSQSKFSWDSLEAAQNLLQKYRAMADLRFQNLQPLDDVITEAQRGILQRLRQDLHTPLALVHLNEVEQDSANQDLLKPLTKKFEDFLHFIDQAFGLALTQSKDITQTQKDVIAKRQQVRSEGQWEVSDQLRDQLAAEGIGIRDTNKHGTIWFRL